MSASLSACPACAAAPAALEQVRRHQEKTAPACILSVPGLRCAACIAAVESALAQVPGVRSARVNLSLKRALVFGTGISEETLIAALQRIGYEAAVFDADLLEEQADPQGRALLVRLAIAGFAMMNVMLLSVAVWSGAGAATRDLFHLISAAITLPVVVYSAQPFYSKAWQALRVGRLNMDVPISLAILLAAGLSLYETLNSGAHAYFDAALSLTFFLLIGRYLDHRSRAAARSAAQDLTALEARKARRVGADGHSEMVSVSELCVGDEVLIARGMRVPVDGILLSERTETDRAFLTGESAPVARVQGESIDAGEINLGDLVHMRATAVGEDTTLRRIASLVALAEAGRNSYTALADRAARIYAPAVHLLALMAFVGWMVVSGGDVRLALNIAIAVLIITCPCALGLAVPAVATAAIGTLFGRGMLVRHGTALERVAEVDHVVFDKTGTLTLGGLTPDLSALPRDHAEIALALAEGSQHPKSVAIARALGEDHSPARLSALREVPGRGVEGRCPDGRLVRMGRADWATGEEAATGTALQVAGEAPFVLPLQEEIRPGIREAIEGLRARGLPIALMTGDTPQAAAPIASALGITTVLANIPAPEKHARISAMAEAGQRVLMVGDGLNDAAALAQAHASIAPGSGLDVARNAADLVVVKESFADLPLVLDVARASTRLSRQNFAIAALYNMIAIPFAVLGYATPLAAALAMSASSITVLFNALRVRRPA